MAGDDITKDQMNQIKAVIGKSLREQAAVFDALDLNPMDTEDPTENIVEEIDEDTWVAKIGLNAEGDRVYFQATIQIQGQGGGHFVAFHGFSIS